MQRLRIFLPYLLFSVCCFILPLASMLLVNQQIQLVWSIEFWWVIAVGVLSISVLTAIVHKIATPRVQLDGFVFTTGLLAYFTICFLIARFFVRSGAFVAIN